MCGLYVQKLCARWIGVVPLAQIANGESMPFTTHKIEQKQKQKREQHKKRNDSQSKRQKHKTIGKRQRLWPSVCLCCVHDEEEKETESNNNAPVCKRVFYVSK